ncbi:MAG: hypothetical protein ABI855_09695 [Bacteroidota bacterium]
MENQSEKEVHIGKMLRKHLDEKRYNQAGLARREGWKARNIAYYFKKPTIQVSQLIRLCHGFRYNFLRQLADQLPAEFPPQPENPLEQRLNELEKENELLKIELSVWKRVAETRK